jgi:hypothetical protein
MNRDFLGDSYDAVKRLWQELLAPMSELLAEPRFIPKSLQADFTKLTGIRMLNTAPTGRFAILNDPDTGVSSAKETESFASTTHISLRWLADQLKTTDAWCSISFDQAFKRDKAWPAPQQRLEKVEELGNLGCRAAYYVSHAPFLFVTQFDSELNLLISTLVGGGLPKSRLETGDETPTTGLVHDASRLVSD